MLLDDGAPGLPTLVELDTTAGQTHLAAIDVNTPERDLTAQRARLTHKYLALAKPVIGADAATQLCETVATLQDEPSSHALMALTRPATSAPAAAPDAVRAGSGA